MEQAKRQQRAPRQEKVPADNETVAAADTIANNRCQGIAELMDSALSTAYSSWRARETQGKDFHIEPTEENKKFLGGFLLRLRPKCSFLEMSRKWK